MESSYLSGLDSFYENSNWPGNLRECGIQENWFHGENSPIFFMAFLVHICSGWHLGWLSRVFRHGRSGIRLGPDRAFGF